MQKAICCGVKENNEFQYLIYEYLQLIFLLKIGLIPSWPYIVTYSNLSANFSNVTVWKYSSECFIHITIGVVWIAIHKTF